jgi:hypothetical protein
MTNSLWLIALAPVLICYFHLRPITFFLEANVRCQTLLDRVGVTSLPRDKSLYTRIFLLNWGRPDCLPRDKSRGSDFILNYLRY